LDTAVLIFAVEAPEKLTRRAVRELQNPENILELSAVSLSEMAIKSALGKLKVSAATARQAVKDLDIRILAYTGTHAFEFFDLPPHHTDRFDRQIIAQALAEDIPVVTPDETFRLYKGLKIIW
jgi:PIN domain nuclease of toxin-antitoxin system